MIPIAPLGASGPFERSLLETNFLGLSPQPAWIGVDPLSGEVVLRAWIGTGHLDGRAFAARVSGLAEAARSLRAALPHLREAAATAPEPAADVTLLRL